MTERVEMDRFEKARQTLANVERLDDLIALERERIREMEEKTRQLRAVRKAWRQAMLEGAGTLAEAVFAFEAELISNALIATQGELTQTAKLLGVSYQGLGDMLEKRHKAVAHLRKAARVKRSSKGKGRTDAF